MPQFDFSTYSSQIFWLLICFGILFCYVKFFFIPKLEDVLAKRNGEIKDTQAEIDENNKKAQENIIKAQENIHNANILANRIIEEAQKKAELDEENALKEVENAQKKAIEEILAKQKEALTPEILADITAECSKIVLSKIGINVDKVEISNK